MGEAILTQTFVLGVFMCVFGGSFQAPIKIISYYLELKLPQNKEKNVLLKHKEKNSIILVKVWLECFKRQWTSTFHKSKIISKLGFRIEIKL